MAYTPDSTPNVDRSSSDGVSELSEFSFYPLRSDFFQQPERHLPSLPLILQSSLSIDDVTRIIDALKQAHISLPEYEIVSSNELNPGASRTNIFITPPRGLRGEPYFNPSYLRAILGRELQESELTTVSLVTRAIAREVIKILDVDSTHDSTRDALKSESQAIPKVLISARLEDFLVSVPHFDPVKHEMMCDATYIGFARNQLSTPNVLRGKTEPISSDIVLKALQELFVDAICTLYTSTESKPIRWGQIAGDPGVYAVLEGIITACNEHNLMEYSSRVCGFTNNEALLNQVQVELEQRWKKYKISDVSS
jgi:hypothetical protein